MLLGQHKRGHMENSELVDPELRLLAASIPPLELSNDMLHELRNAESGYPPVPDTRTTRERRRVPGPAGAPDIELVIYQPAGARDARACIFHIHGGGFIMGTAGDLEFMHRPLAEHLDCVLVSVEYRLAPETIYPGAIEDCYAGLAWVYANAGSLGIDPRRIGVMGESAGGGLAAALALLARDREEIPLAFQHLVYPMIDDRTGVTSGPHPHVGQYVWTAANNHFGWGALLGREPGGEGVSPYAAPARAKDLSGLPQTFISTASLDLFVEENLEYARRLMRVGVPTELHVYPGGFHGFDILTQSALAARAIEDRKAALSRAMTGSTPATHCTQP